LPSRRKASTLIRCGHEESQSSPNQDLHHAHKKARWHLRHLALQTDLSVGEEGHRVMGMTYGVHHGPSNMPSSVPGVPTASAREDRLHPKGWLRQQLADNSTKEKWSRAIKTMLPNSCLAESRLAPIGATEAKDGMTLTTTDLSQ
jgi:hypothetical protein